MSVLRARPPGFAAGINGFKALPLRIGQIARQTSPRLFVSLPVRLRPHRESKPPSHPGGGESPPNPNRQKLLGQALKQAEEIESSNADAAETFAKITTEAALFFAALAAFNAAKDLIIKVNRSN